jgi:hypothetical protein
VEIARVRAALVSNPLDTELRNLYLDIFNDLLVAETQAVKKKLVELGKLRLGNDHDPSDPFIIFEEIDLLVSVADQLDGAVVKFGESLAEGMEGVDPSLFDLTVSPGMPFGFYIFASQQPRRNKLPSRFVPSDLDGFTDVVEDIAGFDPDDSLDKPTDTDLDGVPDTTKEGEILDADPNDSGSDSDGDTVSELDEKVAGTNPLDIVTANQVIFEDPLPDDPNNPEDIVLSGAFRDYSTLLEVLGQFIRQTNELALMRGLRQDVGDLTAARDAISAIQGEIAEDYCFLKSLFGEIEFLPTDTSGVRGAMSSVESGIADAANVRSFLNGETNPLGLDEDFLLIVPSSGGNFDSFDVLLSQLRSPTTEEPLGPMKTALDALGTKDPATGAIGAYEFFRTSLDNVEEDLANLQLEFEDRHQEITGFLPDADPSFVGVPKVGSELATLNQIIANLTSGLTLFDVRLNDLFSDSATANQAVTDASGIASAIRSATTEYDRAQNNAWNDLHLQKGLAAIAQATAEGVYAIAGSSNPFSVGAATGAAVVNEVTQGLTAEAISKREEDLDRAATVFESKLALAAAALAVSEAKLALGEFRRDIYALQIAQKGDLQELGQAQAEVAGLYRELERIEANRDRNVEQTRGRFYADPIHLVRSDTAILKANAAFLNAQRWVWYTQHALDYKWSEQFVQPEFLNKNYDPGSIFMMRNVLELNELLSAMEVYNDNRQIAAAPQLDTVTISFKDHLLSTNPKDANRLFPAAPSPALADDGQRFDLETGEVVSQLEHFRRTLKRKVTLGEPNDNLIIPFNTTLLENINARFFSGPDFSGAPAVISPGTYRDKIEWLAVNIGAGDTATSGVTAGIGGFIVYGGESYFRTRIPRFEDTSIAGPNRSDPANLQNFDFTGEFIISRFRRPVQLDFNKPVFSMRDTAIDPLKIGYNEESASNIAVFSVLFSRAS